MKKKKKKMDDYLSKLPHDLLSNITSMLDIKDAARTSVLSKSWRYIWINRSDFTFNDFNILYHKYNPHEKNSERKDIAFVKVVDQIMQHQLKNNYPIKCFRLQFDLGKNFYPYINNWIPYVIRDGLETLDLDLTSYSIEPFERYGFSLPRIISENKGSLKHIRLVFCNIQCRSSLQKIDSLVSLQLERVTISNSKLTKILKCCPSLEKLILCSCSTLYKLRIDAGNNTLLKFLSLKDLKLSEIDLCASNLIFLELQYVNITSFELIKFIKNCPSLEKLTLHNCHRLTYLKICDSNNSHVKMLSLKGCSNLNEIDLCVSNLHTLEYHSHARLLSCNIKAPRLVKALIHERKDLQFPVTRLCLDSPMLDNLVLLMIDLPLFFEFQEDSLPEFSNVRHLFLLHYSDFNYPPSSLIYYIFKSFPLLGLNIFENFFNHLKEEIEIKFPEKCLNGTITKLELNGFFENQYNVDLLKCLFENLTALKVLGIRPPHKITKITHEWTHSEGNISPTRLLEDEDQWLRAIIPHRFV